MNVEEPGKEKKGGVKSGLKSVQKRNGASTGPDNIKRRLKRKNKSAST